MQRDSHKETTSGTQAERGKPTAEYGQYGLVRKDIAEAEGLNEEQVRGIQPTK